PSSTVPGATGGSTLPHSAATPPTPAPSPTPATTPSTGSSATGTSTGTTGTGTGGSTGTSPSNGSTSGKDTKAGTRTTTSPADATPAPIILQTSASALYDPYSRNTAAGDATRILDGDPGTSFPITVADGSQSIGAGVTVDLGKTRGIREIDLTTKTPGGKVEIYATDSDELPPDVLDTRWAHLKDVSDLGTADGGKQTIALGSGTTEYRHLLLWFTTPPTDGLTVRVAELKLLG
ncbi:MAG: hypothetical protein JWQ20_4166, partial [Conexibacter sp.]|nr:hypothetical protein [Conexibacter sp.]